MPVASQSLCFDFQTEQAPVPSYKSIFQEALREVGVIADLQAIIWGYFDLKKFTFGTFGEADEHLSYPSGICVDKKGFVYVADTSNNRIQIFKEDGKWVRSIHSEPRGWPGDFRAPRGVTVGPDGCIYICSASNVVKYDTEGKFLRQIGSGVGAAGGCFSNPRGLALNADGSLIYVADFSNRRVSVFTSEGMFLRNLVERWDPWSVAVGPDGNIYTGDTLSRSIEVYTPSGRHLNSIRKYEGNHKPLGVAVSREGKIYMADYNNSKLHVFSPSGDFLREVSISSSSGVAISDSGMLYVLQGSAHCIKAFHVLNI